MALTQVTGPYPIFTDLDGSPLDDGYLYIGDANDDPETNPIQVFWDSALTIPATQPIRTNNGYAWRNGTPGLLYTAGEFSITIRNKRNEFVLYSPLGYGFDPKAVSASVVKNDFIGDGVQTDFTLSASPSTKLATNVFINGVYQEKDSYNIIANVISFSIAPPLSSSIEVMTNETGVINGGNANDISYTASFAGATLQSVQTKLEQYVSVKDFGAVGDGVADDTAAINAAIAYCWTQYVRVFPVGVGLTFPAKAVKLVFPDGIYRITSTVDIANGQYEVIAFEAEGIATILWDGGAGTAIRATASSSVGIVTTPISWNGISIRKAGTQKEAGSVAFECERYSNFTVKGMGIIGFDIGVWNRGAIDIHYDFDNRAIENCNIGFLTEQKTVAAGIMKPNLLTISNAYFIQCSQYSFCARRNPNESAVNNGAGSVITIENTNFQGDSEVAVNCEYIGEVPEYGNIAIRNSWFEGAGKRLIRLRRARALVDNCFFYPNETGGYPISLEVGLSTGGVVRSRITFLNCDTFVFNSQALTAFTHGFTNSDAHTVTNSYVNDVFVTTSVADYVSVMNVAMKAGAGVSHRLYVGQPPSEADYPLFVSHASHEKGSLFYLAKGTTAVLAPSASENIYDMGGESGTWQVTCKQADGGIAWRGSAEVFFNGASSSSVYTKVTSNVTITVSGSQIVLTNTNPGSSMDLAWTIQRMAV